MRMPIIICFLLACLQTGYGQLNKKQDVGAELQKLANMYKGASRISFDVTYRYAATEKPNTWLDSLSGHCKISGARYWYDFDNVESVRTSQYVIVLFKEDQVMYLAKPEGASGIATSGAEAGAAMASPVAQLETFLKNDKAILCSVKELKNQKTITIDFTTPGMYKRIEYYVDKRTGLLEKIISLVRSDQLYDTSVQSLVDAQDSYVVVETVYSNYKKDGFDDSLFDSERYFKLEADEYITVAPYHMYKIFKGTPNL